VYVVGVLIRAKFALVIRSASVVVPLATCVGPVKAQSVDELVEMSIEDLATVSVMSVSKNEQALGDAPASIYVISNSDIVRSGATTIPEMLRLAPNLEVYQRTPDTWVVTARGMNGNANAQSFSNKLLVLVDGRAVYSPLFSGVFWDLPDVLPEDIDRIEVISGPGSTLWGANAMNGVINVITRRTAASTGGYASLRAGGVQRTAGARFGGAIGDELNYRVFARWIEDAGAYSAPGIRVQNGRQRIGGGFRLDWAPSAFDTVTLQGEAFAGKLGKGSPGESETSGRSLSLRWNHRPSETSEIQVQAYYDHVLRDAPVDTYDFEFQHSFLAAGRHKIIWGAGARLVSYRIDGTPSFFFIPPSRDLFLANLFVSDNFAITPKLTLTAGLKVEKDPYVGASLLPEARVAWKPTPTSLIWAGVSRAIRAPTPFDRDVEQRAGFVSLSGNREFRTEKLTAYEVGFRTQPLRSLSFSLTGYYHQYDDLRSIEIRPGPGLNLSWDNLLGGHTYGAEAWSDLRLSRWWTIAAGVSLLKQKLSFAPGASGILGPGQLGDDPSHQFKLRSSMNLGRNLTLDADFRAIGALPHTSIPAYHEVGARLAWRPVRQITVSVTGANLLNDYHREYEGGDLIPRKVMAGVELRF
jgi:iron complex outermembrane recepter protein